MDAPGTKDERASPPPACAGQAWLAALAALGAAWAMLTAACASAPVTATVRPMPAPASALPPATATPVYDREEWKGGGWADADGDCQDTRAETLIIESLAEVEQDGCRVVSGLWVDLWKGERFRFASGLHIDHHVPVHNAHVSGGGGWGALQRTRFYNDLDNLNAIGEATNLDKGAKGPGEWRPPLRASWRSYAEQWLSVKRKYGLSLREEEQRALDEMLAVR